MLKNKEQRVAILNKITKIHTAHCERCEDPKRFKSYQYDKKDKYTQDNKYCIQCCEHGRNIRELGRMLEGDPEKLVRKPRPSYAEFLKLHRKGKTYRQIANHFRVSVAKLYIWRQEWKAEGHVEGC